MRRAGLLLSMMAMTLLTAPPGPAAVPGQVAIVVMRGAGADLTARMRAAGAMPHLERLGREGLAARLAPMPFSGAGASTAASIWTGARADAHGVTGPFVPALPAARHTVLEGREGGSAEALLAEPMFAAAARQGKRVVALNAPHTTPLSVYAPSGRFGAGLGDRLSIFDATGEGEAGVRTERRGVVPASGWRELPPSAATPLEVALPVGGQTFFALLYDDPADPTAGYDTALVNGDRSGRAPLAVLKPRPLMAVDAWSEPIPVRTARGLAHVAMRLYELAPDGSRFALFHSAPAGVVTNRPDLLPGYMQAGGALVGGAGEVYRQGGFGPTLADGGDGTAEARYLDAMRYGLYRLQVAARHLSGQAPWDMLVAGVPWPEEAVAMWAGTVTPGAPTHRPALAARLEPALRQVFAELDAYVGALRGALPAGTTLVVVGDRGLVPARWDFYPNVALRQAGLLALDAEGRVDLARTRAIYAPTDGGYVRVNTTDWQGGIVPPAEVPAVLKEVRAALGRLYVKTPGGVVPLVRMFPAEAAPGLGGPAGGALYLDLRPGYQLHPSWEGTELYGTRPINASAAAAAGFGPEHQGFLIVAGAGVARGAKATAIAPQDVAPLVAGWLGIRPPAQTAVPEARPYKH